MFQCYAWEQEGVVTANAGPSHPSEQEEQSTTVHERTGSAFRVVWIEFLSNLRGQVRYVAQTFIDL